MANILKSFSSSVFIYRKEIFMKIKSLLFTVCILFGFSGLAHSQITVNVTDVVLGVHLNTSGDCSDQNLTDLDFGTLVGPDPVFNTFSAPGLKYTICLVPEPAPALASTLDINVTYTDGPGNPNSVYNVNNGEGLGSKAKVEFYVFDWSVGDSAFDVCVSPPGVPPNVPINHLIDGPHTLNHLTNNPYIDTFIDFCDQFKISITLNDGSLGPAFPPFTTGDVPGEYEGTIILTATIT